MKNKNRMIIGVLMVSLLFPFSSYCFAYNNIPVGVFFYVWYGYDSVNGWVGGNHTSHWNDGGGGIVVDYPVFGYYSSLDNYTLGRQIVLMKDAGIDFAIVSFWGAGDITYNSSLNVFRWLKDNASSFKACLMVEPYSGINYTEVYNFVYSNFVEPFNPWYMRFKGKPLLFFFNPVSGDFYKDERFTVYLVGNPPNNVDLIFWKGMDCLDEYGGFTNIEYYTGNPVINFDGIVSILPKYDDKLLYEAGSRATFMQFDRLLNKGLYQKEWSYVIQNKDNIQMVLIYSWNEYHERTAIEPHIDPISGKSQYYLYDLTKYYVSQFRTLSPNQIISSYSQPISSFLSSIYAIIPVIIAIAVVSIFIKKIKF